MVFYLVAHAQIGVVAEFTRAETLKYQQHPLNDRKADIS